MNRIVTVVLAVLVLLGLSVTPAAAAPSIAGPLFAEGLVGGSTVQAGAQVHLEWLPGAATAVAGDRINPVVLSKGVTNSGGRFKLGYLQSSGLDCRTPYESLGEQRPRDRWCGRCWSYTQPQQDQHCEHYCDDPVHTSSS